MKRGARVALGWLVVLVIACIGVMALILGLALVIDRDGAMKYVGYGSIAFIVVIAKLGLVLRDKIVDG